ncbi:MAG: hypothetical protein GWP06_13240 [Actinobacteria bacterium]|nr:hypothetical protein [Actinomycetota bacterium]
MKWLYSAFVLVAAFILNCSQNGRVKFIEKEHQIDVMYKGHPMVSYDLNPEIGKPILYPVYSPSGIQLARHVPPQEGESRDEPHQMGIMFAYEINKANNFWAIKTPGPPRIEQVKVVEMKGEKEKGTLSTINHWIGHNNKPLLREDRTMVFYPGKKENIIDFTLKLTAIDTTVAFQDIKEGMFAIRVADWLREKGGTGRYLSSNGDETEQNVWGKRAKWVRLQGEKNGKLIGIAILNHPQSLNYPTYWHVRGYGLFSANPLGQGDFQTRKHVENPQYLHLTLKPDESALFKFRMIFYEGAKTKKDIDQEFNKYSKPEK